MQQVINVGNEQHEEEATLRENHWEALTQSMSEDESDNLIAFLSGRMPELSFRTVRFGDGKNGYRVYVKVK